MSCLEDAQTTTREFRPAEKKWRNSSSVFLFRYRLTELKQAFPDYSLDQYLLPDGQAGCWAFRMSAAHRLPLTASSYEIEFDLLAAREVA